MRRVLLSFIIAIAFLCNTASAQLEVVFSGPATVAPNGQVSVDVAVNNFTNVISAQFSINWDPSVLTYNSITNITSVLDGVTQAGNIGTPAATGAVGPGQATFSWSLPSTNPRTIPDGTVLFTIVFDGVGAPCSSTDLIVTDDPRDIEVIVDDGNFTDIGAVSNGANIEIDCDMMMDCGPNNGNPICGSGNTNDLGIIGSDELVESGDNACVTVTVDNFDDVQSMEFNIVWDAGLLTFDQTQNYNADLGNLGFGAGSFNLLANGQGQDTLRLVYFDGSALTPVTLADGTTMFDICFDAIGANGTYADVEFLNLEIGDSNQNTLATYTDCGSVEICDGDPPPPTGELNVSIGDIEGDLGENVCVDIIVDGFVDVATFQFAIEYDNSLLTYTGAQNVNPLIVPDPLFNEDPPGTITLNWFENMGNGVMLPDGSTLFSLCFDLDGPCGNSSDIDFSNGFDIEFANSNDEVIDPVNVSGGSLMVNCPNGCMCSLNVTQPSCSGGVGSITIDMGTCAAPIAMCEWTFNGNPINVGGCSLFAAQEGMWAVTVTDDNGATCAQSATIQGPDPITFGDDVTDVSCNGLGSIALTNVTGGNGGYTYKWSNGDTTPTITDLPAADYTVTVCDDNNCVSSPMTFTVDNIIEPLSAELVGTNAGCTGNDGTAEVEVSGGCTPYSSQIGTVNGSTVTYSGLPPGDYTDDISDVNGTTDMIMFTIDDIPPLSAEPMVINSNGADGKITLNTMGGTQPYSYDWSPMDGNVNGDAICDLPPGSYFITITDDRACQLELAKVVVDTIIVVVPDSIEIESFIVSSESLHNGLGVSCNGACDGSLTASYGDVLPDVILLMDESGNTWDNLDADDLCAGTYTLTVTDVDGNTDSATITITEPEQISIDFDVTNATDGMENGAIDITVTGGTEPYLFVWTGGFVTEDVENLGPGFYTVLVTDANNCTSMIPSIEIIDTTDTGGLCGEHNNIITPGNADGINDVLEISCASSNTNTLTIFDRWGREVYKAVNYQNNWNGTTTDGDELGEGTYYHILDIMFPSGERRIFKGSVTILRDL